LGVFFVDHLSWFWTEQSAVVEEVLECIDCEQMEDGVLYPYSAHHEFGSAVAFGVEFSVFGDELTELGVYGFLNEGVLGVDFLWLIARFFFIGRDRFDIGLAMLKLYLTDVVFNIFLIL